MHVVQSESVLRVIVSISDPMQSPGIGYEDTFERSIAAMVLRFSSVQVAADVVDPTVKQ